MSRLKSQKTYSQHELQGFALDAIHEWHWHLHPHELHKVCPFHKRLKRHFLKLTGVAEWQMTSGTKVRSIGFCCTQHGDTWEIRQVMGGYEVGWSEVFVLHNSEYAGALDDDWMTAKHDPHH